ncbi:hypothetical protein F2Q70_00042037 [Brassica cretica]|uniref:RRM domain-containing protein n=1 Tax=Brassica cretica TaxID=69181 RepID=A0A8S9KD51_BRACR|nr:hypothetical protein F2Q70_00042037 [Brassica cretica]
MRTEIPTAAYLAVDEVNEVGSSKKTFFRVFTEIAPPPEEIGTSTRSTLVSEMPIAGALPDMIESHYLFVKNKVCISVEGYDLSLDPFDLDRSLEEHFGSCGTVEYVDVPRHPDTNAISNRCTTVTLRGEFAEEKALALNGTDVEGWTVTVKVSVDVPDVKGRTEILKVHSKNKKLENGVSLEMVTAFGMSEIGPWSLIDSSTQSNDKAYEMALGHITNNREAMEKIVEVLVEKETM